MKLGKWLPWGLVAVLAAGLLYQRYGPRELVQAMAKGDVQAQVAMVGGARADEVGGSDDSMPNDGMRDDSMPNDGMRNDSMRNDGMRVALGLTRSEGQVGRVSLTWPAGSIIYSGNPGEQRLLTARTVAVVLDDATPAATVEVEVYCLDQFALTPTLSSPLSLPTDDGTESEETEPVRKLAQCLEEGSASHAARQFAIWMSVGKFVEQDRTVVRERLAEAYRSTLRTQAEGKLQALAETLRKRMPYLSSAQLDAAVERYRRERFEQEVERTALQQADRDLQAFDGEARSALAQCRDDLDTQPFYAGTSAQL